MSSIGISRSKSFPAGAADAGARRLGFGSEAPLRTWIAIGAAVGLACGLLGWTIGRAQQDAPAAKSVVPAAQPSTRARVSAPDVTNSPFGAVAESAATAVAQAPALPFTLLRGDVEQNQPTALLERDGQRFVARGLAVYGDYLIQVEREQVVFTYLPSATRQRLPLVAAAPAQTNAAPPRAGTTPPLLRAPAPSRPAAPVERSAAEQSESD